MNIHLRPSVRSRFCAATILAIVPAAMSTFATPTANAGITRHEVHASRQQASASPSSKTVWFVVRDAAGKLVTQLTKQDFQIFEDGKPRQITTFLTPQKVSTPLTLGLLLQFSGQRHDTVPYGELNSAASFFRTAINGRSEGFVATFASRVHPLGSITSDPGELQRDVRLAKGEDLRGSSSLYDAVVWACQKRMSPGPGIRNVLVIVSDGHDNSSRRTSKDAVKAAVRSGTQVYFLDLAYADPYFAPGLRDELNREVEKFVGATGGSLIFVHREKQFEQAFRMISAQLNHEYALDFRLAERECDGHLHRIEIRSADSHLRAFGPGQVYATKDCATTSGP